MRRKKFKLSHSVSGLLLLLAIQAIAVYLFPVGVTAWLILGLALAGAGMIVYVATEVIEEVRNASHMLALLSAVVAEFVVFFAFEYWFLITVSPASFPTLPHDFVGFLLHSIMVFAFNPLYLPATFIGRGLLLINTTGALGLVLFILQNVWQFRHPSR